MNKRELINSVTDKLQMADLRKPVTAQKAVFHISDDEGNSKDFVVRKKATALLYTQKDVGYILDAFFEVIAEALAKGDNVAIHNFGTFAPHYRAGRTVKHPVTEQPIVLKEKYIPKFSPGAELNRATMIYEQSFVDHEEVIANGD